MYRIDMRKFDDVRHLVRARLLSSEFHDVEKIVKEHIAADVWKTYYLALPAPDSCAPWDITYSLLEQWPDVTIDDLSTASAENEAGTQTLMKMSEVLHAYLEKSFSLEYRNTCSKPTACSSDPAIIPASTRAPQAQALLCPDTPGIGTDISAVSVWRYSVPPRCGS